MWEVVTTIYTRDCGSGVESRRGGGKYYGAASSIPPARGLDVPNILDIVELSPGCRRIVPRRILTVGEVKVDDIPIAATVHTLSHFTSSLPPFPTARESDIWNPPRHDRFLPGMSVISCAPVVPVTVHDHGASARPVQPVMV